MEFLGKIFTFLVLIVVGFLIGFLRAHILLDVSNLYGIVLITENFSFAQIYGIMIIFSIGFGKLYDDNAKKESDLGPLGTLFSNFLTMIIVSLLIWGSAYVASWILL